jgi:hypothetical protein
MLSLTLLMPWSVKLVSVMNVGMAVSPSVKNLSRA